VVRRGPAVDLAGNKQKAAVSVTYTVVWGMKGFIAPTAGTTIARTSKTITVRFRLALFAGNVLDAAFQIPLAAAHDVRATLSGQRLAR